MTNKDFGCDLDKWYITKSDIVPGGVWMMYPPTGWFTENRDGPTEFEFPTGKQALTQFAQGLPT